MCLNLEKRNEKKHEHIFFAVNMISLHYNPNAGGYVIAADFYIILENHVS